MKIMMSAGEVSGDLHGENLARAIRKIAPTAELMGFGGERMAAAGVRLVADCRDYSVMGVLEVLKSLGRIMSLLNKLTKVMEEERPDLLVLIDYPDFNWRLAKRAKKLGIPVFSYIPPSAWAWRKGRAKDCAKIATEFVAIFPHELAPYEAAGARISFVGNPLVDSVHAEISEREAREYFHLAEEEHAILLLPGSRRQEIELLLDDMLGAVKILREKRPGTRFFLAVGSSEVRPLIEAKLRAAAEEVTLVTENRYVLMGLSDAAIAASGTVVMETALMHLPTVSLYRFRLINYLIGRLLVHIDAFTLPNILMGRKIQPELLQDEVEPERIAGETLRFYRGEARRAEAVEDLKAAAERLGPPGAATRIAQKIVDCATREMTTKEEQA